MALTVPFADADDLAARWRPLSDDEATRAGVLLSDASEMILDADREGIYSDLVDPPPNVLVRVVCAMVKRAMLSGTGDSVGVTQESQTAGPFTVSSTFANPTGDLYLTAGDRRSLRFSRQRAGHVELWEPPTEDA